MACDFHTHNPDSTVTALISSPVVLPEKLTSLEVHPWDMPDKFDPDFLPDQEYIRHFQAIGETGLDKLRGPDLRIQQQYLQELSTMAADLSKPLVLHCVRSFQEIFTALKAFKLRVMIHGFRSSPEILDELWKRRFTVSFHPSAVHNPILMNKLSKASGAFGFESDDNRQININELIYEAEKISGIDDIEKRTDQYFADFTGV